MLKFKDYSSLFRILIRIIPIIFLLALSYYVSNNYNTEKIYYYEFNTRLIGLGIALLSIPFFNTFLFGHFSNRTKNQHHYYVKTLVILSVLTMILESEFKIIAFSVSSAYLIRSAIVFNSMAKNKSMNSLQMGIFYFSLVIFYPLLLLETTPKFLLVSFLLLIYIYYRKLHRHLKPISPRKTELYMGINSASGLALNNFDLIISKLFEQELGLAILYAKRIVSLFDITTQTFVQSITFSKMKKLKPIFFTALPLILVIICFSHTQIISFFLEDYQLDYWILALIIVSGIKAITVYYERTVLETGYIKFYSIIVLIIISLLYMTLFLTLEAKTLFFYYLLSLFLICLIRSVLFKFYKC